VGAWVRWNTPTPRSCIATPSRRRAWAGHPWHCLNKLRDTGNERLLKGPFQDAKKITAPPDNGPAKAPLERSIDGYRWLMHWGGKPSRMAQACSRPSASIIQLTGSPSAGTLSLGRVSAGWKGRCFQEITSVDTERLAEDQRNGVSLDMLCSTAAMAMPWTRSQQSISRWAVKHFDPSHRTTLEDEDPLLKATIHKPLLVSRS